MTAVSKSVFLLSVLTFLTTFLALVTCTGDTNQTAMVEKLKAFQKIKVNVFEKKDPIGKAQIDDMKVDELKSKLQKEYKTVRCSYLVVCLDYLNKVSALLSVSLYSHDLKQLVRDAHLGSLVSVSCMMLATTMNTAELSSIKDLMWILHVYVQWLHDRFVNGETAELYVSNEVFLTAYPALCELLKQVIDSESCSSVLDISVDLKSTKIVPAERLKADDIQASLQVCPYVYNIVLCDQLKEYEMNHLMSLAGWEKCGMEQLCLNNIVSDDVVMRDLEEKFGMMKTRVLTYVLETDFKKVCVPRTSHLADTIYKLSKLLRNFFKLLKVVMVRIIWYYIDSEKISTAHLQRQYNKEMLNILDNFIEFLDLHDDETMKTLVDLFKYHRQYIFQYNRKNIFIEGIGALLVILDDIPNDLLTDLPESTAINFTEEIPENEQRVREEMNNNIKTIVTDNELKIDERICTMPESVYRAFVFLEYLKKKLHGIDFKIAKDFCNVSNSEVHLQFWALQNRPSVDES